MKKEYKASPIPKPPTSLGLSRRLVILVVSVMLSVMVLFLVFLKHYTPKDPVFKTSHNELPIDQAASSAQIDKIQQTPHRLIIIESKSKKHSNELHSQPAAEAQEGLKNTNAFQQGSDASISVYHNAAIDVNSGHINNDHSIAEQSNVYREGVTQNRQSEKIEFLQRANQKSDDIIQSAVQKPHSPYELKAGTIIPATLMTGINSGLPGTIIAKVRRDVFDTVTGNYCLIPQGTTLIGEYDSQIADGQTRVLIVWSRLIFPNGSSIDLRGMPGVDLTGMAGLHDKVNNHYMKVFGNALLFSLFGAVGQLSQPKNNTDVLSTQQILYAAIGQQMNQTAMQLIEKKMNIQPTIKLRQGINFNILLTKDFLIFL